VEAFDPAQGKISYPCPADFIRHSLEYFFARAQSENMQSGDGSWTKIQPHAIGPYRRRFSAW
jgi:hypothetical protein